MDRSSDWLEAAVLGLALLVLGAVLVDRTSAMPRCYAEPSPPALSADTAIRPTPTGLEAALHEMLTHD